MVQCVPTYLESLARPLSRGLQGVSTLQRPALQASMGLRGVLGVSCGIFGRVSKAHYPANASREASRRPLGGPEKNDLEDGAVFYRVSGTLF